MTEKDKDKAQLMRLADAMVDDILQAPDVEIMEDFTAARGDPVAYSAQMQARFQKSLLAANKSRLHAARSGLAAANAVTTTAKVIDIANARQILRQVLASPAAAHMTLAARNESELSDADVRGILNDLQALGIWTSNGPDDPS